MKIRAENIHFVLVEPKHPGNVGAVARAMKTMGFKNLMLVNPGKIDVPEARWMAHASEDILENARVFTSLEEALSAMHVTIATTQRKRGIHLPFLTPEEIGEKVVPISQEHQVALVFGREDRGLNNEELAKCHLVSTIPAAVTYPALNLSQAVMIYCYELFKTSFGEEKRYQWKLAAHSELEALQQHLRESLEKVHFEPIDSWENFLMRFRRFFARAHPEVRDVRTMHLILKSFEFYIEKLERELERLKAQNQ